MDDITTEEIQELARTVGFEYSKAYPGIDRDDIAQAVLVDFYDNVKTLEGRNKGWVRKALATAARKYCNKERADYLYYSSQYVYTPRDVRSLLEVAYTDGYDSHSTPTKGDKDNVLDAGSVVVSVFDLLSAMERLNEGSKEILDKKLSGYELTGAELRKYYRSVEALVNILNRHLNSKERVRTHEGPGNRKVIRNTFAQALVQDGGSKPSFDTDLPSPIEGIQKVAESIHPLNRRSKYVVDSPWRNE